MQPQPVYRTRGLSSTLAEVDAPAGPSPRPEATTAAPAPRAHLYAFVFLSWALAVAWFQPRIHALLSIADTWPETLALGFFAVFMQVAWLYAFYNLGIVLFAILYRRRPLPPAAPLPDPAPQVGILYTTCNDFSERSATSCVEQRYPSFRVYILDDGSDPACRARIDRFAARFADRVTVVRRPSRRGFKAGNLNHALRGVACSEPIFALADADEILPPDFLERATARLLDRPDCGFVQANHGSNPESESALARALGVGIDIHWRWYHPLRNRYGFVMLLGHGAVVRRSCWQAVGGFPEIVSEDLAFAVRVREAGWRGVFEEDLRCLEDFPPSVRAFRIRHMKWTRGTCEFLVHEGRRLLRSPRVSLVEKIDILFPTVNLPLSLLFFLFLVDANVLLPLFFGYPETVTAVVAGHEITWRAWLLDPAFSTLFSPDFYAITVLTLLSPVLCFMLALARRPIELSRFLARSTALYGALGPLSCVGVVLYFVTGRAVFHVTADGSSSYDGDRRGSSAGRLRSAIQRLLDGSHPDNRLVQGFEVACGVFFSVLCLLLFQISFLGIALAFLLLPVLHHVSWENAFVRRAVYVPFLLLVGGLAFGGLALVGVQTVLLGFGFHF